MFNFLLPKTGFEKINMLLLLVCAGFLAYFIPVNGAIDHVLSLPWVDATGHYYLKDNYYLVKFGHIFLKNVVIAIAIIHVIILVASFWKSEFLKLRKISIVVLLSMLASVSIIGILKVTSVHACPWDMVKVQDQTILWSQVLYKKGACFPGGHASAGFALFALYFAYRDAFPKLSKLFLLFALLMGIVMSGVQMLRGAHFLSHNLWALWWSWCIDFLIYKWFALSLVSATQLSQRLPNRVFNKIIE